jgi:hypothetical protein
MNPQSEQDLERVQIAVNGLAEHFDTIEVFCTRHEGGMVDGTVNIHWGAGNYFARYGQIKQWMVSEDEDTRSHITRRVES